VSANATAIVRDALAHTGIELVASCGIEAYDALAPEPLRSMHLMPTARGLVVVGSAGPTLWRRLRAELDHDRARWSEEHPLDRFVAALLAQADAALSAARVSFRRFEAAFHATPRLDFVAMARLVGLGSPGPFGMLVHVEHGAWWALRGAWMVDGDVDPPAVQAPRCLGCPAPCVGGWANARGVAQATPEARSRCVVGQGSRYDDDQIAYHYDRAATVARLQRG
jgi:epoxyqueuosine reductase QueG